MGSFRETGCSYSDVVTVDFNSNVGYLTKALITGSDGCSCGTGLYFKGNAIFIALLFNDMN